MPQVFTIHPVGVVHKPDDGYPTIEIEPCYQDALLGVEGFSHLVICYWFHRNDTPDKRRVLQVHPRKDRRNPLTGVFGTHSPLRPNPLAMTCCRNLGVAGRVITLDRIDAFDGSPVIDIKPYIPLDALEAADIRVPDWV